ncbi:MAG: phytanoyl-CoA dioxygenase family protein [Actinomycetota bacterium]
MSRSITKFGPNDPSADVVAEIRRNGVAIVEDVFATDAIDALRQKVETELDKAEPGGGELFGDAKRSISALFARGVEFSETLLLNERVLELMDAILLPECPMASTSTPRPPADMDAVMRALTDPAYPDPLVGPNCHHYRINATVAMQVCRGGQNQFLHRDQFRYLPYMVRDPAGPELTMAVMVPATDFTTDNGATRFVPGSNHWPDDRFPQEHEVVQAVMSKGSAAFWLGSVYHGLGINHVDEPRTGFIYSFGLDHLAQEENQFLAVPPPIAETLPLKARQLLGYRSSPSINWVQGLDKDDMLTEGESSLLK